MKYTKSLAARVVPLLEGNLQVTAVAIEESLSRRISSLLQIYTGDSVRTSKPHSKVNWDQKL